MAHSSARLTWHYGWVVVFAGALSLFACLGLARFAYGMLLPAMGAGLGLAFGQMGFISTGNFAGYLTAVALVPALIRRFRPRATIVAALLLITLCMLGISLSRSFWQVLLLYTLVGIGSGLANIPVMVLVSHWFRRERRGRAAGLMVMGSGAGIVFSGYLIPALNRGLGVEGWRSGWQILALLSLAIAGIAGRLLRNDPAELGLEPVGSIRPIPPQQVMAKEAPGAARILLQLGLLYLIFGATYMVYGTFIVTTMVVEYGFAEARAGMFWSWVGWCSLVSGVGFGVLSDRIGRRGGLAVVFTVQTAAYLLAGSGGGTAALLLSVVLYGVAAFAIPTIMAAAVGDYLGLSRAAQAFSLITFFFAVGQTVGPGAAGVLAEASGTFTTAYLAAAALTGAAVLLTALLPKPETSH
jgi:MFS family permease